MRQGGFVAAAMLAAILVLGGAAEVGATGFFINQQSVGGLGRADAGNAAAARDASTVFFNPAGMTELWRDGAASGSTILEGGTHVIIPRSELNNTGSTAASPGTAGLPLAFPGTDASDPGRISPVLNGYLVHRFAESDVVVGIGLTAPFGLSGKFEDGWFGRYDSLKSELRTINVGPVVAVPVNRYLSVGGGLDVQYADSTLRLAVPNPLTPGGPTPATDGTFEVHGDGLALGYNFGLLVKVTEQLRLGAHYRSEMRYQFDGSATTSGLTGALAALNTKTGATAPGNFPDILTTGIAYDVDPRLSLYGEFSWYGWGRLGNLEISFADGSPDQVRAAGFRDTYAVGVGAEYAWSDKVKLRSGFKFDRTPTVDRLRDTTFADANRYWLAAGASYALSDALSAEFAIVHVLEDSTSVDVTRTFFAGTAAATAVRIRSDVDSSVTTVSMKLQYRF